MEFFDHFEHTIDAKGRLVLPAAYRAAFAEGGIVTYLGRYAALFTPDGWDRYRRKLENDSSFTRVQLQYLFAFASPFNPDAQHRVPLNRKLRELVGIDRKITIVGSGSHAAIYSREAWEDIERRAHAVDESGLDMVEKFDELGFL